jgi:glutamate synthase domain-containing protein 2
MERVLTYVESMRDDVGGVVIQQNKEDAYNELWNRVYSDQRLDEHIQEGRIAFEIKGGQGAKAGLGGEKIVDRDTARRLKKKHTIVPDPDSVEADTYERHSAPDIFTEEILDARIKKLRNDYPRVKIWFKTGPYRDLRGVMERASRAGADCIVVDGKEGGTGMSPSVALEDLGIPTLVCLQRIQEAKKSGLKASTVISGRLYDGAHLVKALALGADAVAMGRPFLVSSYAYRFAEHIIERELYRTGLFMRLISGFFSPDGKSEDFVRNFVESVATECRILISALGKYDGRDLGKEDVGALNRKVAKMFAVEYIYANA